jgi:hypothetical protein
MKIELETAIRALLGQPEDEDAEDALIDLCRDHIEELPTEEIRRWTSINLHFALLDSDVVWIKEFTTTRVFEFTDYGDEEFDSRQQLIAALRRYYLG